MIRGQRAAIEAGQPTADMPGRLPVAERFSRLAAKVEKAAKEGKPLPVARTAKGAKAAEAAEIGVARERRAGLIRQLNPPLRYKAAKLDGPPKWWAEAYPDSVEAFNHVQAIVRRFVAGAGGVLVLLGPRGLGKTYNMWGGLLLGATLGKSGKMIKAADLFIDIESTWTKTGGPPAGSNIRRVVDKLVAPNILAIDELSEMQADKDWQSGRLTYITDQRYDRMAHTIFAGNDTEDTFKSKIGASILSRMEEKGMIVVCNWPSLRKKPT
jgi:DNA replication protein DnaC